MYYPYLRAKQMELLALRDFVEQKRGDNCVMPIIEPQKSPGAINRRTIDSTKVGSEEYLSGSEITKMEPLQKTRIGSIFYRGLFLSCE